MPKKKDREMRPPSAKAIREQCFRCCGDMIDGRIDCQITGCPLYYWQPYRQSSPDLSWMENGSSLFKNRKELRERVAHVRACADNEQPSKAVALRKTGS